MAQKFVSPTFRVWEAYSEMPADLASGEVLLEHNNIRLGTRDINQHQFKK